MSDQDVFNQDQTAADQAAAPAAQAAPVVSATDAFADKLGSITNADGSPKYTDVAQALDSIPHAQQHIQTLESEAANLKSELAKAQAAKELLEKAAGQPSQQTARLSAEEVAEITQRTIAENALSTIKADNVASVNAKFSELYGDKASEQMKALAKDSGMTVSSIRELAEKSPLAVYRMAGINASQAPVSRTPDANLRGDNFIPPARKVEMPKSVMSGATSKQMVENWRAAGEIIKQ